MNSVILKLVFAGFAAFMFAMVAQAEEEISDYDKFRLWNSCAGVTLDVIELSDDASDIGLTKNAIQVAARSRLRGARVFTESSHVPDTLVLHVDVFKNVFHIGIGLRKVVNDNASEQINYASTWFIGTTGTHNNNASYILGSVGQGVDRFIDEYLRVNAEACEK